MRGAAGRLSALWQGEDRTAGVVGEESPLHPPVRRPRGPAVPRNDHTWDQVKALEAPYMQAVLANEPAGRPRAIGIDELRRAAGISESLATTIHDVVGAVSA